MLQEKYTAYELLQEAVAWQERQAACECHVFKDVVDALESAGIIFILTPGSTVMYFGFSEDWYPDGVEL
jgi:hypothetical protein